jgi:hypothetical protein
MEPLSFLATIPKLIKKSFSWVLGRFGYKLARLDDYKDEEVEVGFDYPSKSPKCIKESEHGSKFYWSEKYNLGYEKYFEIDGHTRRFFKIRHQFLWIKRPQA